MCNEMLKVKEAIKTLKELGMTISSGTKYLCVYGSGLLALQEYGDRCYVTEDTVGDIVKCKLYTVTMVDDENQIEFFGCLSEEEYNNYLATKGKALEMVEHESKESENQNINARVA